VDEIVEWFLGEFGHLGFDVTPIIYNPFSFIPRRKVTYYNRVTNISITPEIANDISGGFAGIPDPVVEYKQLLREAVYRFLDERKRVFTPIKKITKLKFI
jgi:hypothetical protein